MRYLQTIIIVLLLLADTPTVSAQFYDIGQAPASTRWKTIESGNFSVIYPAYYTRAGEVLFHFRNAEEAVVSGTPARRRHTPLILHPLNPVSNAYAVWAPRRIEILTTPPQDSYAHPWFQQLALHEYRHIVQLSSLDQGFTRFLGYVFGQQAAALSTGIFVPSWYLEGDAVMAETAFSSSGRGRVPSFSQTLQAQLSAKGAYSYAKASLGSYRDFVPDIYTTGYHIISATNLKFGLRPWQQAMNTVAREPWSVTPFNRGLKRSTGLNKKGLYREAMKTLDSLWKEQPAAAPAHLSINGNHKSYTNYLYPYRINDSLITAFRKNFTGLPQLVAISKSGKVKSIHTPGYIVDDRISFDGRMLTWAEYRPHLRWETDGFTSIVQFDPLSGQVNRQDYRRKLYAPAANPGTGEIAAIEYKREGDCYLTILGPSTIREFRLPDSIHGSNPCWSPDGRKVVIIATGNLGKAIAEIIPDTGGLSYITGFSFHEVSNLFFAGTQLCFTGNFQGKSQIFMADEAGGRFQAITDAQFGADYASINKDELIYSDYTADGYRIAVRAVNPVPDRAFPDEAETGWPLAEALSSEVKQTVSGNKTAYEDFEAHRYSKAAHLFSLHSWAPLFIDIGGETVRPGFSVMSQNLLSTLFISGGYDYNIQEEAGMFRADITWKGWFPILKATISEGLRAGTARDSETGSTQRFTWNETNLDLGISQRLNLSKGAYTSALSAEAEYNFTRLRHNNSTPEGFAKGNLSGLSYRAAGFIYRRQAYRDLAPRLGIYAGAEFRHTPFGQLKAGSIVGIQMQVFLPGMLPNHSLLIYGGVQFSNPEQYRFQDLIPVSRGYSAEISGNDLSAVRIIYRLPLFYPDLHAGGLIYIKRVRAGLFHDLTRTSAPDLQRHFSSSGLDLVADFHLFGLSTPISAGFRTIYLHSNGKVKTGLLFSVNLYEY